MPHFVTNSLARRFALIFGIGTLMTLVLLGSGLAIMLKHQIEQRDQSELDGKSEVIQHLLTEIVEPSDIVEQVSRIQDVAIGHGFLQLGLLSDGNWLLRPDEAVANYVDARGVSDLPGRSGREQFRSGGRDWWLRHLRYTIPGDANPTLFAVVGARILCDWRIAECERTIDSKLLISFDI